MTQEFVFPPAPTPAIAIEGGGLFPVRRIFCVGRNYADHVAEMGGDPKSDPPIFFSKPADAVVPSGATIPYPHGTENLHFEGELVVALAGRQTIFGYAAGCDLTRRDLQLQAKKAGQPWDMAKGFDRSAPIGALSMQPPKEDARLRSILNDIVCQDAPLSSMIWRVEEILASLGRYIDLQEGDLVFTGTPSGVGELKHGDQMRVEIEGLPPLAFDIDEEAS